MTMPAILPGAVPAPATQTPNGHGTPATGHDGDATAFALTLTVLIGHEAPESPCHVMQSEPQIVETTLYHPAAEATEQAGEAILAEQSVEATIDEAMTLFHHPELAPSVSPLEAAADEAIGDPIGSIVDAALAAPLAIAMPQAAIMPDEKPVAESNGIHRALGLVNTEFRERLERVIERMESEFGYKVEIAETYRTQERQDALYAQGRTEPGPVVTWTRSSNHTLGRAADLVIDGSYDDALAYERLMRIAREEGLRTLGPRDPGHVELALDSQRASAASVSARDVHAAVIARPAPSVASMTGIVSELAELESPASSHNDASDAGRAMTQPGAQGIARVAPVARVASVAQVAQVAMVGAQAAPAVHAASPRAKSVDGLTGSANRRSQDKGPATANAIQAPSLRDIAIGRTAATSAEADADAKDGAPNDAGGRGAPAERTSARDTAAEVLRQTRDELMRAVTNADPNAATSTSTSAKEASPIGHADMSERISRLLKVQEAANERPLSQMLLKLDRPDGGEDRLRVDLRGNTVSATLDTGDQGAADRLGANVKELQRALERHGFETDSVTVRTMTRSTDSSTLARAAGASAESDLQRAAATSSGNSTNTSSRDRGTRNDEQRPSPDSQRQRSRKEQKGDR